MRDIFKLGDEEVALFLSSKDGGLCVHLDGETFPANASAPVAVATQGDRIYIHLDGETYEAEYRPAISHHARDTALSASDQLVAPMPGAVVACAVKPGDAVAAGDLLLVIESMKLETPFKAWRAGRVESVHVSLGQTFERDKVLLSLEAA